MCFQKMYTKNQFYLDKKLHKNTYSGSYGRNEEKILKHKINENR